MLRVALLDTTVPHSLGSMARYREQLKTGLEQFSDGRVDVSVKSLGCTSDKLNQMPAKLRMWRRHFEIWKLARSLDLSDFDLVHLLDGSFGYVASLIRGCPVVTTVHDVIPRLQMEGEFEGAPPVGRGAQWMINRCLNGVRGSRAIAADSQSTADDLVRYSVDPSRLQVIPLGIESELFTPCDRSGERREASRSAPFILHLGNNGFYKNRSGAIRVFDQVDPALNLRLVLAGPEPDARLLEQQTLSHRPDRIDFVVDPDHDSLCHLYREAALFLFPSQYEGFGWPPLEAMACGCPVVSSDAGSLPEVVGDAGIIAGCGDVVGMARGCERLVRDESFRDLMILRGRDRANEFNIQRLAERMTSLYEGVRRLSVRGEDAGAEGSK